MQIVRNRQELNSIIDSARGYILNEREDRVKLHRATCGYVITSWPDRYTKYFFATLGEAKEWANQKYGEYRFGAWTTCGAVWPDEDVRTTRVLASEPLDRLLLSA